MSRAQQQLCRDVPLLVLLRGVEIVLRRAEIRAGILPVAVEEQLVELVRQIVVVGDVAARARDRIVLVQAPHEAARGLAQPQRQRVGLGRVVRHQDVDEIVKAAFLDGQRAGHIGLRHEQPGLQQQLPVERRVVQPDRRRGAGRALEHMPPAGGVDDAEPADTDEAGEHRRKQHGPVISGKLIRRDKSPQPNGARQTWGGPGGAALTEAGHGPRNEVCRDASNAGMAAGDVGAGPARFSVAGSGMAGVAASIFTPTREEADARRQPHHRSRNHSRRLCR